MSTGYGAAIEYASDRFSTTVEPGSAYLVVLSMTGLLGALSLIWIIGTELFMLKKFWSYVPSERKYEIAGIGSLLFVHGGAEGWIYSAGAVMCLYFWIWMGRLGDTVDGVRMAEMAEG
jgi:hypothetical protein